MSITIALAGNPNSGKTTLFNALTGSNQFVGNWPGVTVEKKEGKLKNHSDVTVTDLPGIYSLSPYSPEEVVARNYLIEQRPDVILNIVDGTNLGRNLYLTTQLAELGIPLVVAVNMMDIVKKNGDRIDIKKLSQNLGCPVVEISALKENGINQVVGAAISAAQGGKTVPVHCFSDSIELAIAHIEETILNDIPVEQRRWYAVKFFEQDEKVRQKFESNIKVYEPETEDDTESVIINERYAFVDSIIKSCYNKKNSGEMTVSDKIDSIVTNRYLGLPVFAVIMFAVYWIAMVGVGAAATDWTNDILFGEIVPGLLGTALESVHCATWLQGLIMDGIVAGVGAVLGFVPQMLVLFFMLAFLEDCGYMARIAFVLDRIFRKFGMSGKSFIPMLVGTGCSVPGIMASRTIQNDSDRRITIITTSFIPCGAKVPFIALISGAIFGGSAWVATSAYFVGMFAVIVSGLILRRTKMFRGDPTPFVMELPAYHLPLLKNVLRSTWERGRSFIKKAGTIILLSTVVIWFMSYFGFTAEGFRMLEEEELGQSILAMLGGAIAWIFIPLGWGSWQAAVASITGLVAKENIVGTMSVLYSAGEAELYEALAGAFTPASGYSFLVFNLLCAPCFAAIGAIRREMNSAKWTWFAVLYQCGFAYAVALIVNVFGNLLMTV